jgi:hypothetical protein
MRVGGSELTVPGTDLSVESVVGPVAKEEDIATDTLLNYYNF